MIVPEPASSAPLVDEGMAAPLSKESDGAGCAGSGARAINLMRSHD
jgi:hypothetical protein